jgi:hypothetical protein
MSSRPIVCTGFTTVGAAPSATSARANPAVTRVLPTSVSVPVMK